MSLPQVSQVPLPQSFHRGRTIGAVGNAIAAAGRAQDPPVKYNTRIKRIIRIHIASLMIRPIASFNDLTDQELWGMSVACNADVAGIVQWLGGQNYTGTTVPGLYDDMREERADAEHFSGREW